MKIGTDVLRRFVDLPRDEHDIRDLLDDVGVEVKRAPGDGQLTVELLANRGDHYCYEGIAVEIAGRTGSDVRCPPVTRLDLGESPWPLRLETPECLSYTATLLVFSGTQGQLGAEDLRTLAAADIHPISPAVDATNLVNLEIGQPAHAFDADTLVGPVTIRSSRAGETALPLFQDREVELPVGTLVIADDEKILAIAGVIGCEGSKTTASTTRMLLESAAFDPVSVRKASRALGIHTDSSARFERGSDPSRPLVGAGRVVHLLELAGWKRVGATGHVGGWSDPQRTILLDVGRAREFLRVGLSVGEARDRLERYGFTCTPGSGEQLSVLVPPVRLWDVETVADLYEELAKSIGYNNTPVDLPPVGQGALPSHAEQRVESAMNLLVGLGFQEVVVDGFYGRPLIQRFGLPDGHPLLDHVETTNALERAYSLLKNNGLAQALDAVATNARMRTEHVKLFEVTRTFHPVTDLPDGPPDRERLPCAERDLLWAVVSGSERPATWAGAERPADSHFLVGVVAELAAELDLPLTLGPADPAHQLHDVLHPGRQAVILLDGVAVGVLGEAHPRVVDAFKLKRARPCYLELDLAAVRKPAQPPRYVEPPSWQPIVRSLAFTLPHRVESATVQRAIVAEGPDWLDSVQVSDRFDHESDGVALHTLTYTLNFANPPEIARSADAVNAVLEAILTGVERALADLGVVRR
ncbi:MAG: phenylalanyl-tRNA synthetase beta chain [Myxococcota bacterium]|jgi:phenylalanyl-tRNA synthetase beta chain